MTLDTHWTEDAADTRGEPRSVLVFDAEYGPAVSFIRSLGRAGVDVHVASPSKLVAGRFSRYNGVRRPCPGRGDTDRFVAWLVDEFRAGSIDLIAPTSDFVMFCVGEALERLGRKSRDVGHPLAEAVRTCLFKYRFSTAMESIGFPTPPTAAPLSLPAAEEAAEAIGYPVVLKPRSHLGVGGARGAVVSNPAQLAERFIHFPITREHSAVFGHVPDLASPLVQRYYELGTVDVVSVSGCLDMDGAVMALGHSRKLTQSPRRLGVGTMFEPLPPQPFTDAAVGAVREVLGSGLFELEVLVDKQTGEYWAIDLNPRAFGQVSLDIAMGHDLPCRWYESVTGTTLEVSPRRRRPPKYWHSGVSSYLGFAVRFGRGPKRTRIARHALGRITSPSVGAVFEWRDPLPGVIFGLRQFRHPRSLIRPFLVDTEVAGPEPTARTSQQQH